MRVRFPLPAPNICFVRRNLTKKKKIKYLSLNPDRYFISVDQELNLDNGKSLVLSNTSSDFMFISRQENGPDFPTPTRAVPPNGEVIVHSGEDVWVAFKKNTTGRLLVQVLLDADATTGVFSSWWEERPDGFFKETFSLMETKID